MIRYGSAANAMRPMAYHDLLILRLKLLIITAKAYLKGYPLGNFRKTAITMNARYVFYNARKGINPARTNAQDHKPPFSKSTRRPDQYLIQRVQLLAIMLNASANGKSKGHFRNKAMGANIDHLCGDLADRFQLGDAKFLKVA